jgi:hypothetical protein
MCVCECIYMYHFLKFENFEFDFLCNTINNIDLYMDMYFILSI